MAEIVANLLIVKFRSPQSCKMRFLIAVIVFISYPPICFFSEYIDEIDKIDDV